MTDRTFAMLKPDALRKNLVGRVLAMAADHGFRILAMRMPRLTEAEVDAFYGEHRQREFYSDLRAFMLSGPVVAVVLSHDSECSVRAWRSLMGATDSRQAREGTIRFSFGGAPVYVNAVHGSDSPEAARRECAMFFPELERDLPPAMSAT